MSASDIDPDLERQLDAAGEDQPVEAVLLLRDESADIRQADVDALAQQAHECDQTAELNYMAHIGVLIVRANARALRLLISQPVVVMASANRIEGDDEL